LLLDPWPAIFALDPLQIRINPAAHIAMPADSFCAAHGTAKDRWPAEGPIFSRILRGGHVTQYRLGAESVRLLVKRHAARIGLDGREYGAHSLCSGLATSAVRAKAPLTKIMEITRHKDTSVLTVALFEDHAARGLL
jgi:hypothetical protein